MFIKSSSIEQILRNFFDFARRKEFCQIAVKRLFNAVCRNFFDFSD